MNYLKLLIVLLGCLLMSCNKHQINSKFDIGKNGEHGIDTNESSQTKKDTVIDLFLKHPSYVSNGFDFPVGKPNARGYYNAQKFGRNNHLGDDWNAVTGGNSDLGDPIYATANGFVNFAQDVGGGWGKVIRIWHQVNEKTIVESLYAHCDKILIKKGTFVRKGDQIGTIGNADGLYLAHLHFELRDDIYMPIGKGYSVFTDGYLDPALFVKTNR